MSIVVAAIVLGVLITVHELGHFLVAKGVGMHVKDFAIGFGPAIAKFKKAETLYAIRLFPLGGYVRVLGEDEEERSKEGSMQSKSVLERFMFVLAGPFMNFILAILLFMLVAFAFGLATNEPEIGAVVQGEPADEAGFLSGDEIVSINQQEITTWEEMVEVISDSPNKSLNINILREGTSKSISVVPQYDETGERGVIGITPPRSRLGFIESISYGFSETVMVGRLIFEGLRNLFFGGEGSIDDLAGPVGIVALVGETVRFGIANLIMFTAVLSVNLGILNLLPIPALDGSRLVFLIVEGVRGKPVDPEKEGFVHVIGVLFLLLLFVVVMFNDIMRLLS
ncbi:RIP metalloprotease RseP [Proteinivorax hydrogeniformans]|uniref:Zinc metalloprotease n=1 Tax=Proteinivorax hydrogeniformans TaxID=1826727 RepID=A0AAU8HPI0_9FIRM